MVDVRSTTTVSVSARLIREDGVVDEAAPQTHGWTFRLTGMYRHDQEAIEQAIMLARARFGATHENFRFDRVGANYVNVPDASMPRGYRYTKLYDYEWVRS